MEKYKNYTTEEEAKADYDNFRKDWEYDPRKERRDERKGKTIAVRRRKARQG